MANRVLTRILEEPQWVQLIQSMRPALLARLIDHVGLEDAADIVALATTEQLKRIFDEDLWRSSRPGKTETFDAERFGTWLSILLEAGTRFAADKLSEMDEDFLGMAFAKQIYVIDLDALALSMSNRRRETMTEDDLIEKALESSLSHEFEGYVALSRHSYSWDAVITSLVALDESDHDLLVRLLERICHLSMENIDDNGGLYAVLSSEEQLDADVASDRQDRRSQEGFVAPEDATAFLKLARGPVEAQDWISPRYFRDFNTPMAANVPLQAKADLTPEQSLEQSRLYQLLKDAEVIPPEHSPLLLSAPATTADPFHPLRAALESLGLTDPTLFGQRMAELNYLSNTVIAGCSFEDRPFRPSEAAEAVLAVCSLGASGLPPDLGAIDMIALFRRGMRKLNKDLTGPLRDRMNTELNDLDSLIDVLEIAELEALRALLEDIPRFNAKLISTDAQLTDAIELGKALALKIARKPA